MNKLTIQKLQAVTGVPTEPRRARLEPSSKPYAFLLVLLLIITGCSSANETASGATVTVTATTAALPTENPIPTDNPTPTANPTATTNPTPTANPTPTQIPVTIGEVIEYEMQGSFAFFWEQVLSEIKSEPRLQTIPVVILTSSAADPDVSQAYLRHANSYLVKPLDLLSFEGLMKELGLYWFTWNQSPRP